MTLILLLLTTWGQLPCEETGLYFSNGQSKFKRPFETMGSQE
jgi:hypothetical protein